MDDQQQSNNHLLNMQNVLQLAIEAQGAAGATPREELENELEDDPERKEWLKTAIGSMSTDFHKEMKIAIDVLKNLVKDYGGQQSLPDEAIETLEETSANLVEIVSSIDFAQDFVKMDGFSLIKKMIEASSSEFAVNGFDILAETLQNNEYCQTAACNHGLLKILIKILQTDNRDEILVKALYALSCLIRANKFILKAFEELDGLDLLISLLEKQSDSGKLRIKAAFLLSNLCQREPRLQDTLQRKQIVFKIVNTLKTPHNQSHEHLLSTLCALISNNQELIKECQKEENLKAILEDKISTLSEKDEYVEEVNYCKTLLQTCFQ